MLEKADRFTDLFASAQEAEAAVANARSACPRCRRAFPTTEQKMTGLRVSSFFSTLINEVLFRNCYKFTLCALLYQGGQRWTSAPASAQRARARDSKRSSWRPNDSANLSSRSPTIAQVWFFPVRGNCLEPLKWLKINFELIAFRTLKIFQFLSFQQMEKGSVSIPKL